MTRSITRRRFLEGVLAGGALGLACERLVPRAGESPPNLLVLVTDDQRADTLGCMGNPVVQTPHLDALAAEGVVFDQAFVTTSVCAPSRASILTGQYTRRHGIDGFATPLTLAALASTYPVRLRAAGYRTGFFGKWGLGGPLPREEFDRFEGTAGQGDYFQEVAGERRHSTELLASSAIGFLEQHAGDRPFCLSISFNAPHGPWLFYDPQFRELYRNQDIALGPTVTPEAAAQLPAFLRDSMAGSRGPKWLSDLDRLRDWIRDYYRMITGVDVAVGRLREALARLGLAERTVILFTSDNGMLIGERGLVGKWLMYEESIRIPLIVWDPRLPEGLRGRRLEEMALNIDLAPTLLALAGVPPLPRMQGRSLLPLLRDESVEWREDWFYEHALELPSGYLPTVEGVRTARWKYVRYLDPRSNTEALYDLRQDPDELENRIDRPEARDVAEALRRRWQEYRTSVA